MATVDMQTTPATSGGGLVNLNKMLPLCKVIVLLVFAAGATTTTFAVQQPQQATNKLPTPRAGAIVPPQVAVKVNFTDCGPKNIKEVRITPCPGDGSVCNINLGTNVTVEADFIAKQDSNSLSEVIKGVIRGRELQFPEQRADPCKSVIFPSCPIKTGKHYQYKAIFEVKPHYPAISVKVRYALTSREGDTMACVQIAAKIVDPSPAPMRTRASKSKKKPPTA